MNVSASRQSAIALVLTVSGSERCKTKNHRSSSTDQTRQGNIYFYVEFHCICIEPSVATEQLSQTSLTTNSRVYSLTSKSIRGQYAGHVITLSQSEANTRVTWWLQVNQRPIRRSCDHSQPIRGCRRDSISEPKHYWCFLNYVFGKFCRLTVNSLLFLQNKTIALQTPRCHSHRRNTVIYSNFAN